VALFLGWHVQTKMTTTGVQKEATTAPAWEARTEPLDVARLRARVPEIAQLLNDWRFERVDATYGYGCNLPMNQLWQATEIDAMHLDAFVTDGVRSGIIKIGSCDLHIEDREKTIEFRICHESDVHFESTNKGLVDQVVKLWLGEGFTVYVAEGPKGSALPKNWTRLDPQIH
jgi:hypothetical protein